MLENYPVIYLDREFTNEVLASIVGKIYGLSSKQIFVSSTDSWSREPYEGSDIVCDVKRQRGGEFPIDIEFLIFNQELRPPTLDQIGYLCELGNCRILVEHEEINPYLRVLVTGRDQYQRVWVDEDKLNNEYAFVIAALYEEKYKTD